MVPYINSANHAPGVKICPHPGCHYRPLTINGKKTSKTIRPTSNTLCIYQYLVIPCINLPNHAPEVQFGHVLGVIFSHRLIFKKKLENFSEIMRQTAQVSSITYLQIILCNKTYQMFFSYMLAACCLSFYTPPHFSVGVLCYTFRWLSVRPSVLTISDR